MAKIPPHRLALSDDEVLEILGKIDDRVRLHQVEAWLRAGFPTAFPVRIRIERIATDCEGECYPDGRGGLRIRVETNLKREDQLEVLHHEWAHAMAWPSRHMERDHRRIRRRPHPDHPDEFWLARGRIYRAWHEEDGWRRSGGY